MSGGTLEAAYNYHEVGLSVLPVVTGTKKPACRWQEFTERPQKREELQSLFARESNIGLICGSVSKNLAVLDVDSREKWDELGKSSVFRKLKANSPVVRTHRGFHVYLYAPDPLATKKCEQWHTDIRGENSYAVAPPSEVRQEHGQTQLYLFTEGYLRPIYEPDPQEWSDLQELFGLVPYQRAAELKASAMLGDAPSSGLFYGLGMHAMDALLHPREVGKRSEAEYFAIYRGVAIGWNFNDIAALFENKAAKGTKYREKEAAGYGKEWLLISYQNAQQHFYATAPQRWHGISYAIDILAHDSPFQGRTRYFDASVLRLILQSEREAGKTPTRVSYRLLAERTGRPLSRVYQAVERLQERGALIVQGAVDAGSVSMFSVPETFLDGLLSKRNNISHLISEYRETGNIASGVIVGNDAYQQKALGSPGPYLVRLLNELHGDGEVFSVSYLKQKSFSFSYTKKALALLERAGLVEIAETRKLKHGRPQKIYRTTRRIGFDELDEIAKIAGTKGAQEKQRRQYQEEREAYAKFQASH